MRMKGQILSLMPHEGNSDQYVMLELIPLNVISRKVMSLSSDEFPFLSHSALFAESPVSLTALSVLQHSHFPLVTVVFIFFN